MKSTYNKQMKEQRVLSFQMMNYSFCKNECKGSQILQNLSDL